MHRQMGRDRKSDRSSICLFIPIAATTRPWLVQSQDTGTLPGSPTWVIEIQESGHFLFLSRYKNKNAGQEMMQLGLEPVLRWETCTASDSWPQVFLLCRKELRQADETNKSQSYWLTDPLCAICVFCLLQTSLEPNKITLLQNISCHILQTDKDTAEFISLFLSSFLFFSFYLKGEEGGREGRERA